MVVAICVATVAWAADFESLSTRAQIVCWAAVFVVGIVLGSSDARTDREAAARTRERVRAAEAELEAVLRRRVAESPESEAERARLTLSDLWSVTHRRLDHYHGIALAQAAKSFQNAQFAMVVGFLLLVGFAAVGLTVGTTAGGIVTGTLGVTAAALAGYVSRTFVRSQETAASHLRAYFDQPLEFSRYLAAERLIADANLSEERRAEILTTLVAAMISGNPAATMPEEEIRNQSSS
ncbi:hypothetical protein [Streptomyces sp. VNUA74]|uniref:hypothetical protein n=1 Tax=Streptomyces sp. VNUA74 TaxID=3062685 RepID=UPI00280B896F|nr:hypothetical protein [Streptomyces sp. VNUA74]WML82553.1 hypothetical protein Q3101_23060 [Streptomyces sp. VNUA74]